MTFSIIILISFRFNAPISSWLKNLKVEYGSATLSSAQSLETTQRDRQDPLVKQENPKDSHGYLQLITTDDPAKLKQIILNWRENAYLWEYKYLNHFLVPHTKDALFWLYKHGATNFETYSNLYATLIPDLSERSAVLTALESHFLILPIENGILQISEKGKEYTETMLLPIMNSKKSESGNSEPTAKD